MIASIGFGIASPLFAAVFGDMLEVLSEPDIETARRNSQLAALKLGGIGFGFFVPTAIQGFMFAYSGSKLVERVRYLCFQVQKSTIIVFHHKILKFVQAKLKQEMGWYDREKNNTGALCARLSTSAEVKYWIFDILHSIFISPFPGCVRRYRFQNRPGIFLPSLNKSYIDEGFP